MKSSFVRRGPAAKRDPGTRPGPYRQTLVSSGLGDLDRLLGGGLPLGCLLLVLEDSPPEAASAMLRNFLAEGLAARQPCSWAAPSSLSEDQLWLPQQSAQQSAQQKQSSQPGQSSAAANGLPQQPACSSAPSDGVQDESSPGQQQDHLRIAWQYRRYMVGRADAAHAPHPAHSRASQDNGALPVVSAVAAAPAAAGWCHSFDLSRPQPAAEAAPGLEVSRHSSPVDVVALAASAAAAAASSTAVSRIAVQSLGFDDTTPDSCVSAEAAGGDLSAETAAAAAAARDGDGSGGGAAPGAESQHSASEAGGVVRAVHALKSAARRSRCAIMVSVPAGRFEAALAVRLQHMADAVVALEAIAPGAQLLQILPEPDTCRGMLRVVKLPGVGALAAPHPEVDLLLVRRHRRRLALQPLDVDPDAADALLEAQQSDSAAADVKDVQDDLDDDESDSVNTIGVGTGPSGGGMLCGGGGRPAAAANPLDF